MRDGYLHFIRANRRFLAFGFFMALSSSFGQTYFIGIFGPAVRGEFGLSHTAWGSVYMAGTLASAALLPWSGKLIDAVDLRRYAGVVCLLLAVACVAMASAGSPALLVVAIFALRQCGQGLASHVAITSMARYFHAGRGRAIAVASLGFAAGEAFLPFAAVLLIGALGWRQTYGLAGAAAILVAAPTVLWLLRGHTERHREHLHRLARSVSRDAPPRPSWTRAQMLRDTRFWLLLPGLLSPSLIVTALFFHNLNLADAKGWSHAWITGNYVVFAALTVVSALTSGPLIDRLGALRLLPVMLVPVTLALVSVATVSSPWVVWLYLGLLGAGTGLAHTLGAAVWAELYGVTWLGAIKSLAAALSVFSSALGPVSAGVLMDAGLSLERVCLAYAGLAVLGTVLMAVAALRPVPVHPG